MVSLNLKLVFYNLFMIWHERILYVFKDRKWCNKKILFEYTQF